MSYLLLIISSDSSNMTSKFTLPMTLAGPIIQLIKFFLFLILAIMVSPESPPLGTFCLIVPDFQMVMKRKFNTINLKFWHSNRWLNFLSLPFDRMFENECWMFAPRSRELKFLQYYLQHAIRPGLTVLSLERGDLPALYNLARRECIHHRIVNYKPTC